MSLDNALSKVCRHTLFETVCLREEYSALFIDDERGHRWAKIHGLQKKNVKQTQR